MKKWRLVNPADIGELWLSEPAFPGVEEMIEAIGRGQLMGAHGTVFVLEEIVPIQGKEPDRRELARRTLGYHYELGYYWLESLPGGKRGLLPSP